jgi:P27 family predicted phage terminase small subunit
MRGRKPTATVLKVLRGNPGKRPINQDEPLPADLALECPGELTEPDARTEWTRVIVPAIQRGQITADDRIFAVAHCELWATWRSQLAEAAKHAHVVAVGKNKYPTPNPARVMANKTLLILAKVDAELGFSPTARTRVKATKQTTSDPLKERYFSASRRRA